jgi:hypothetical protein
VRGRHGCGLCSRRSRIPVGVCSECHSVFCDRHGAWNSDHETWMCTRCSRGGKRANAVRDTRDVEQRSDRD